MMQIEHVWSAKKQKKLFTFFLSSPFPSISSHSGGGSLMSFVDGSVVKLSEETRPPSVGKFSVPFPCKDLLSTAGSKGGMSSSVSLSLAFSFSVFLLAASFFSLFSSVVRPPVFSLVASFFSLFSSIVKSSVFSLVASFFSLFTSVVTFASFSERFNKLGPLSKALSVFDSTLLLFSEIC